MSRNAGLVKFDFLGLKTLSVLRKAVDLLARRGIEVDLDALPWDDPQVYELLQRGDTVGVFQLESEGMRRTLAAVKPTNFGDIIALVSLYRPGPDGQHPAVRPAQERARKPIEYPHRQARRHPRRNLRHLRLSGTGDAGRAGAGRLLARRCRPAAPRDGQEGPGRDGRAARSASSRAARKSRASKRARPTNCST